MLDVIQAGAGEWHGRKPQDVFCTTSRTHLPKGACRPLLDTPCGWRGCGIEPFRTRATSGRCITSQGFHAPTPRPSSSRLDSDRASFPRSPEPHRPKGWLAPWNQAASSAARGAFLLPIDPMTKGLAAPLWIPSANPLADWMRDAHTGGGDLCVRG